VHELLIQLSITLHSRTVSSPCRSDEKEEDVQGGTKQLSGLKPNDAVRIQMQRRWVPGVVIWQAETLRSYILKGPSSHEYQRNHKYLRKVAESILLPVDIDDTDENPAPPPVSTDCSIVSPICTTDRTSGGCIIRVPRILCKALKTVIMCLYVAHTCRGRLWYIAYMHMFCTLN